MQGSEQEVTLEFEVEITDLDPHAHELQYHAVAVPEGDKERAREQINGPVEDLLNPFRPRKRPAR